MKERYMKDLLDIRKDIDKIDEQIVKLYEERMKLTSDVAEYKICLLYTSDAADD